ncbi:MAG TPA: hypothetical protein PKI94_06700 [Candidatus Gastranaerophilaceae bacterium]|nr:hypothetical protein [Candidatus Gastranaerophilaceae bacterium]
MSINSVNPVFLKFSSVQEQSSAKSVEQPEVKEQKPAKKASILDKFETGIKDADYLNDKIQLPRTTFQGYLAFMTSAALTTLASIFKGKTRIGLNILSASTLMIGSFYFVRPYIFKKDAPTN